MFFLALATLDGILFFLCLPGLSLAVEDRDEKTYNICVGTSPLVMDLNLPKSIQRHIRDYKVYFTPENSNRTREINARLDSDLAVHRQVLFIEGALSLLMPSVKKAFAGTYSVQLTVENFNQSSSSPSLYLTLTRNLRVRVWENHQVGDLRVAFGPVASRDERGDWYVYLRCGAFNYDTPPFHVVWNLPGGNAIHGSEPRSTYENGSFVLRLPSAPEGGTYICLIPEEAKDIACSSSNRASLTLNEAEMRLRGIQAYQAALLKSVDPEEMERLTQQLDALEDLTAELRDDLTQQEAAQLTQISELRDELRQLKRTFQTENSRLRENLTRLTNSVNNLEAQEYAQPVSVSFSTLSNGFGIDDVRNHSRDVTLNDGDAFDSSTGCFTAPLNGTYFFLADVQSGAEDTTTLLLDMTMDDVSVAQGSVTEAVVSRAVHALLRLTQGQQLCLRASSKDGGPWRLDKASRFMGFLLRAD